MNPKQYRIGNTVRSTNIRRGTICKVREIREYRVSVKDDMGVPLSDFEPVPIDAKYLESVGFKTEGTWHCLNRESLLGSRKVKKLSITIDLKKKVSGINYINCEKHIEYIHELENIYYSITGEELKP